ncbi:MAG: hypothetical protein HYT12_00505 [Candidatus Liptonbacteria bacterium]|nr:hypothetical protein [Candidatus Liptonbacteria bacterium]
MANKLFVFDLDDTLVMTQVLYDEAKIEMWEYMRAVLGDRNTPSLTDFLRLLDGIDAERVKTLGLTPERFVGSMELVYGEVYRRKKLRARALFGAEIRHVSEIAQKVFSGKSYRKQGLVQSAERVLKFLKGQGDCLVLFTKGDLVTQAAKADALFGDSDEMKNLFNVNVFTEGNKTPEEFSGIAKAEGFHPSHAYSVGNSFKSDILPALHADFKGIYIPYETWKYEMEDSEKNIEQYRNERSILTLYDIDEIRQLYWSL